MAYAADFARLGYSPLDFGLGRDPLEPRAPPARQAMPSAAPAAAELAAEAAHSVSAQSAPPIERGPLAAAEAPPAADAEEARRAAHRRAAASARRRRASAVLIAPTTAPAALPSGGTDFCEMT